MKIKGNKQAKTVTITVDENTAAWIGSLIIQGACAERGKKGACVAMWNEVISQGYELREYVRHYKA